MDCDSRIMSQHKAFLSHYAYFQVFNYSAKKKLTKIEVPRAELALW